MTHIPTDRRLYERIKRLWMRVPDVCRWTFSWGRKQAEISKNICKDWLINHLYYTCTLVKEELVFIQKYCWQSMTSHKNQSTPQNSDVDLGIQKQLFGFATNIWVERCSNHVIVPWSNHYTWIWYFRKRFMLDSKHVNFRYKS